MLAGVAAWFANRELTLPPPPGCVASVGGSQLTLDFEQAADAATVAAEGLRLGVPGKAVTVAFAAALQESQLHDLDYGDLDSVGVFQQRPSQGWGSRASLLDPAYAATAFYRRLLQVPGWAGMDPGAAAQVVQRSADPGAYAQWEPQAQLLTEVFTGQVPAGLACTFTAAAGHLGYRSIDNLATGQLGAPGDRVWQAGSRGWAAAAWLVAHAHGLGVSAVAYAGRRWTPSTGHWVTDPRAFSLTYLTGG